MSKDVQEIRLTNTAPSSRATFGNEVLHEPTWLTRNYYNTPWMAGAIFVTEGQIAFLTVIILSGLGLSNTSGFKTFQGFVGWFFVTQPLLPYYFILLGFIHEDDEAAAILKQRLWPKLPWLPQGMRRGGNTLCILGWLLYTPFSSDISAATWRLYLGLLG